MAAVDYIVAGTPERNILQVNAESSIMKNLKQEQQQAAEQTMGIGRLAYMKLLPLFEKTIVEEL